MRPWHITVVVIGDMVVFLAFVILGKSEHEITLQLALLRTALPFAIVWFVASPWLGAYRSSILYHPRKMLWKLPIIWLLCAVVALLVRAFFTNQPLILSFMIVTIAIQGLLIVSWRGLFLIVTRSLSRS